ncbi:MAG: RNA polymerase sigma factor, partial [Acidobacteria bacterium]|nr:RNA polymerase sigma factor [Acidobacteriota bacterium]
DESAFIVLYERLKGPIFKYAFYMTSSSSAAEEVTQEVFLALLESGKRYKVTEGDVAAFVFGIARNMVKRMRRQERPYQQLPSQDWAGKRVGGETPTEGLTGQLIRNEKLASMRAAIASLPDHYRQVVVICDLCDFSYEQAAARLGCAIGTIRSRLNRAHRLLALKLRDSRISPAELRAGGTEECLI